MVPDLMYLPMGPAGSERRLRRLVLSRIYAIEWGADAPSRAVVGALAEDKAGLLMAHCPVV